MSVARQRFAPHRRLHDHADRQAPFELVRHTFLLGIVDGTGA